MNETHVSSFFMEFKKLCGSFIWSRSVLLSDQTQRGLQTRKIMINEFLFEGIKCLLKETFFVVWLKKFVNL